MGDGWMDYWKDWFLLVNCSLYMQGAPFSWPLFSLLSDYALYNMCTHMHTYAHIYISLQAHTHTYTHTYTHSTIYFYFSINLCGFFSGSCTLLILGEAKGRPLALWWDLQHNNKDNSLFNKMYVYVAHLPTQVDIGDAGSIPGSGRFPGWGAWQLSPVFLPGEYHGQGAWQAAVHRVAKSWTRLKQLSMHARVGGDVWGGQREGKQA